MKRVVIVAGIALAGLGLAAPAAAARPAAPGCYGASISALASNQVAHGAFGAAVVGFAQAPDDRPGLGDGVQALQAGDVPDDVVPNSCN